MAYCIQNTMSNNFKSKIGSFLTSILEKSVLGYFSNIKKNIVQLLESTPDTTLKVYYAYVLLVFLVGVVVSGLLVMCIGGILILVTLFDNSVDKLLLSGILFTILGLISLLLGIFILKGVGSLIHSSVSRSAGKLVKKIEE